MKVIWTPRAASDLPAAVAYISRDNERAAARVATRIYKQIVLLESMPERGRLGVLPGTRELTFHPWSYLAVYRIAGDSIRVLRIRHGARLWP